MEYSEEETQIFNAFTNYPFDDDPIFNQGKTVIISNLQKKIVEEMKPINQANEIFKFKIYYWTKKFQKQINITKYNKWLRDGRPVYEVNNINVEVERILGERLTTYDFDNDECFQNGISTLKERFKDNEENLNMALNNAKVFYLRKLIQQELMASSNNETVNNEVATSTSNVTNNASNEPGTSSSSNENKENDTNTNNQIEDGKNEEILENIIEEGKNENKEEENDENKPKYPKSFYEICEMIAKGLPVPGIRQIPNKINEGTPSKPSMKPRPKPWELKRKQYENLAKNNNDNASTEEKTNDDVNLSSNVNESVSNTDTTDTNADINNDKTTDVNETNQNTTKEEKN